MLGAQRPDGAWTDFSFPYFGQSDVWTTAYIGWRLATLPPRWRTPDVGPALERAVRLVFRRRRGGWGFNDLMPVDADSTAHAVLLLEAVGAAVPERAYRVLADHQQADGGFATFRRQPGMPLDWCTSHPDVTPVALLALAQRAGSAEVSPLSRAMSERALQDGASGALAAFWWNLEWYTLAAWARYWQVSGCTEVPDRLVRRVSGGTGRNALDQAFLLELQSWLGLRAEAEATATALSRLQLDSARWPVESDLRMSPHLRGGVDPPESCSTGALYGTMATVWSLALYHDTAGAETPSA